MHIGTFAGRLGRDAELKELSSGKTVANFSLAVDVGWGDNKETLWVDCSVWGDRGAKLAPMLVKGKQVTVTGRINLRTFTSKTGEAKASMTCDVQELTLQGGGERPTANGAKVETYEGGIRKPADTDPFHDDQIPF